MTSSENGLLIIFKVMKEQPNVAVAQYDLTVATALLQNSAGQYCQNRYANMPMFTILSITDVGAYLEIIVKP